MNKRQVMIYRSCRVTPPTDTKHALGCAYWIGRNNPSLPIHAAGPNVGLPGSDTRAAFMAGRDDGRTVRESEAP